ncbi:hypothetical protein CSB37_01230 [bacterium DOLZORAL124_38_8]|nr:MAG: hypothetical protein CSB37_01230 [bacterium DOLZORAL124_38_8]
MNLFSHIWEALYPPKCVFCRRDNGLVCPQHQKELDLQPEKFISPKQFTVFSVGNYSHPAIKKFLTFYKFNGIFTLSDFMGQQIIQHWSHEIPPKAILIPIPLHWSRFLWRGFNQSTRLAQALKKHRPDLIVCQNLKRVKRTKQQAKLDQKNRLKNMQNVFQLKPLNVPTNTPIFLIDDVYTSGATLHEAKNTLAQQGFTNIQGICFARTKH